MRIAHLTSAHPRYDVRIFHKECRSLARIGHEVHLVVADGKGSEVIDGVHFHDVGLTRGRFKRMLRATGRVFNRARVIDADVYHIHDPELLPTGYKLKKLGKRVIFDSHEDVPLQILGKPYLNRPARWLISKSFALYESWVCSRLDAIVAATPFIRDKFAAINRTSVAVNNFPMLDELALIDVSWSEKSDQICYIGSMDRIRGVVEVVEAIQYVSGDTTLAFAGALRDDAVSQTLKSSKGWLRTNPLGFLDRQGVKSTLSQSQVGLVTLHPAPNYLEALPVKMFEYMAAGLPVVASDFPLWRSIVEDAKCGMCVDPLNPRDIAKAVNVLIANPVLAEEMGRNGRDAVREKYNWGIEEKTLYDLYISIDDSHQ